MIQDSYSDVAHQLADASGEIIRRYFRQPVPVDIKPDQSPVTLADRAAEETMRALIRAAFPAHGIVGEEFGAENAGAEYVWVLDPIDGTRSFMAGRPLFGTLIALTHRGVPVLGIIDQPITRERWVGVSGKPSLFLSSQRMPGSGENIIRTRPCPALSQAVMATTSPHLFDAAHFTKFEAVRGAARDTLYGGDCYAYAQLASGFIDIIMESGLKPYDFCALVPVIQGAGGIVTDWQGKPVTVESDGNILACGDTALHAAILAMLSH